MKMVIGLTGIVLIGVGVTTLAINFWAGICAGLILAGAGLVIDALRK